MNFPCVLGRKEHSERMRVSPSCFCESLSFVRVVAITYSSHPHILLLLVETRRRVLARVFNLLINLILSSFSSPTSGQ